MCAFVCFIEKMFDPLSNPSQFKRSETKTSLLPCCLRNLEINGFSTGVCNYVKPKIRFPLKLKAIEEPLKLLSEVGGESRNEVEAPQPGIQAQRPRPRHARHAPAPHARHDRSMARSCFVSRMIFEEMSPVSAPRVQRPIVPSLIFGALMKRFLT